MLVQCQKERDAYYEIPDWRGDPIYETLQEQGNFNLFLQLVDKTQYSVSFKGNGLWTVFAPNDVAVNEWLAEKGYSSVDVVPVAEANKIVAYSMVFNKYRFEQLSHILFGGWDSIQSVKKRTPYYETIRREKDHRWADSIWVVDANSYGQFIRYNNYKYIPFYLKDYFDVSALTADDYNMFYSSPYTGRNIQGASVPLGRENISASNGIIHEVDRVNEPLPTIEQLLDDPNYSKFKNMLEKRSTTRQPYFYQYWLGQGTTEYYRTMFPDRGIDQVYIKSWRNLYVPINTELFENPYEEAPWQHTAETNGYTIFAPRDEAVDKFYDEILKDYYTNLDDLPLDVLFYFINAHFVDVMVWPAQYSSSVNSFRDFINGTGKREQAFSRDKYIDIKPASNGFFFGSNDYIKNRYFESVYTEILLRPNKYMMMNAALQTYFGNTLLRELLEGPVNGNDEIDYTVLLITDQQFEELGVRRDLIDGVNRFTHPRGFAYAEELVRRIVSSHVFQRLKTSKIDASIRDFTGNPGGPYNGWAYAVNDYGDMIRYKDGQIQMAGNFNDNDFVTPTKVKTFENGQVFSVDKLLKFPDDCLGAENCDTQNMLEYIRKAAEGNRSNLGSVDVLNSYFQYMEYIMSPARGADRLELSRDNYWTILMPNNASLRAAIDAHHLPTFPNLVSNVQQGRTDTLKRVIDFFRYHIIPGKVYVNDGLEDILTKEGIQVQLLPFSRTATSLRDGLSTTMLNIEKDDMGNLLFSTYNSQINRSVTVIPDLPAGVARSNIFGLKAVLHEVNGYLAYKRIITDER